MELKVPWRSVAFAEAHAAAGKTKQGNYYKMQDGTASICEAVTEGQVGQLIDPRDKEVYYVGKLKDGKCWMLDNLRLGDTSTIPLTPADTNITSNFALPASSTSGFTDNTTGYTQPAVNADYKNTITTSYGAGSGKIGSYYNYCSASAGTYCYSIFETGSEKHDICPAGWRMPTGGESSGEYKALAAAYNNNYTATNPASLQYNLSTPLSGFFDYGSASYRGGYGCFWSSTISYGGSMRYLYIDSDTASPTNYDGRFRGNSVRCLLGS